ncbi:MAG: DUF1566 domain-containing protein [Syntrophales bacterium]|jgi:hypothetical protein
MSVKPARIILCLILPLFLSFPGVGLAEEINKDGRFVANNDGTVLDQKSGLMWATKDNGEDVNWQGAQRYCERYRGGGFEDWRMPTLDELASLYDNAKTHTASCGHDVNLTESIGLTCAWAWTSEKRGSDAALFFFTDGRRIWRHQSFSYLYRALPVRSSK